jgi:hypothetical protein
MPKRRVPPGRECEQEALLACQPSKTATMSTVSIITRMLMRDQGRVRFLVAEDIPRLPGCERGSIHSRAAMLSAGVNGVSVGTGASWLRILGKTNAFSLLRRLLNDFIS